MVVSCATVRESGDDGVALLRAVVQGHARRKLCLRTSFLPDLKIDGELSDRLVTYKLSFLPSFSSSSCLHTSTSIELLFQTIIDHDCVLHTRTFDKPHIINFTTTAIMDSGAPQNNQNTNASGRRRVTSPVTSLNDMILMTMPELRLHARLRKPPRAKARLRGQRGPSREHVGPNSKGRHLQPVLPQVRRRHHHITMLLHDKFN